MTRPETFFELKIRPVLATKCLPCHGGKKTNSGLKVDSREALLARRRPRAGDRRGRSREEPAGPGHPSDRRRLEDAAERAAAGGIDRGACRVGRRRVLPGRRSRPRSRPRARTRRASLGVRARQGASSLRPTRPAGRARPIDRFVAARRRAAGLSPVRRADRRTFIRRVTFDLIGLPPTPEEISDFLADPSPDAFSHVVDRLLASPHYGERWGRHWMDVVRYADTAGDNADYPIPEAARYRDYIIDSFNDDKPYDQFVREQLAGDILARQVAPERLRRVGHRHRVSGPFAALCDGALRALAPDARGHDRHDRPRIPGPDAPLRPLPRPQVRPGHPARLLRALRHLRQHDVSLRRLGGAAIEIVPADEFRPDARSSGGRAKLDAIPETAGRARSRSEGTRVEERSRIQIATERDASGMVEAAAVVATAGPSRAATRSPRESRSTFRFNGGATPPARAKSSRAVCLDSRSWRRSLRRAVGRRPAVDSSWRIG